MFEIHTDFDFERLVGISEALSTSIINLSVDVGRLVTRLTSETEISLAGLVLAKRMHARMDAKLRENFIDQRVWSTLNNGDFKH